MIEYFLPAVNVVTYDLYVGPSPRINISFFLLSTCTEELMSTPQILTLQPNPPLENENVPCPSNPVLYPEYLYSSKLAFLVNLTAPNKQFSKVGSKYLRVELNS